MSPELLTALGTFVVTVGGFLGGKQWIDKWVARREARAQESKEIVETQGNIGLEALKLSIADTRERVAELKTDITQLKGENEKLERKVEDLRRVVDEYRSGLRVPIGMVLIPLAEIRYIREHYAGALKRGSYPGEHEDGGAGSVDVRMYPLPPGPG